MPPRNFEQVHTVEKQLRGEEFERLGTLPGFQRLSEKQKQFIKLSLYVQDRAERGTDMMSAAKIAEVPEKFKASVPNGMYIALPDFPTEEAYKEFAKHRDKYAYEKSQRFIESEFCHKVVKELESLKSGKTDIDGWVDPGPISSLSEMYELLALAESQYEYPLVLEIAYDEAGSKNMRRLQHTAILLGKDAAGYVVWEKAGLHLPFQLVPLEQVYHAYMEVNDYARFPSRFWRLRPLDV